MRRVSLARHPVSNEVGATLGTFVSGGVGPTHSVLTGVFTRSGFGAAAPYDRNDPNLQPNKEDRVRRTILAAVREPEGSRELVEGLLAEYRAVGFFEGDETSDSRLESLRQRARAAFARISWELTDEGELHPAGVASVVATTGRPAIEDQLNRLRRASDDPALMLGTAKEMLESTAKYVCKAFSVPYRPSTSFDELWHHARDRLGILPQQVKLNEVGAKELRAILQSSWEIAQMTNRLRNDEGTGHGRILPTVVGPSVAHFVVREACSVVQLVLETLDRQMGK